LFDKEADVEEFEQIIKYFAENIEGLIFAGLVGRDGLPISVIAKENLEKAESSAEIAEVYNSVQRTVKALQLGNLEELFFSTERVGIFVVTVSENYFIALGMKSPANIGRARLETRRMIPKIKEMIK
jgi:predicted regulator of Ras-like GTPase activity (Roadblock/LC7/MglB family)